MAARSSRANKERTLSCADITVTSTFCLQDGERERKREKGKERERERERDDRLSRVGAFCRQR
jgi:hypothetical protein